ncbi:hypothetical protein GCM10011521_05570 [Arenimonas soli]|uniref:Uncharacterized protein n=1 Tax=Arenimonas soli TaxID=2269504 RepID=A0ABQ1HC35_9GAMM|nr:hypothetical protein [Arenimonas soli]GGA70329.1 hypothetical protein GCM10011521_05570 [Arenimonas soli]
MNRLLHWACLALLALAPAVSLANNPQRVDDSASQVLGGLVRMQWLDAAPGNGNLMAGQVTVLVRLDTSPWLGRNVRIYQVLAKQATPVRVEWSARGPLLPGAFSDGERALVYAGPVTEGSLSDTFVLTIFADGNLLERPEVLDFYFEIELEGQ